MRVVRVWNSKFEQLVHSILLFILQFSFEVPEFVRDMQIHGNFLLIFTKASRNLLVWNLRLETIVITRNEILNFLVHMNLLYVATVDYLRCFDLNTGKEIVLPQKMPFSSQLVVHKSHVWCKGITPAIWDVSTNEVN